MRTHGETDTVILHPNDPPACPKIVFTKETAGIPTDKAKTLITAMTVASDFHRISPQNGFRRSALLKGADSFFVVILLYAKEKKSQ